MQGKVEICGVNTAKLKVLSNDEITELLHRTKGGDFEARQALIAGNLRLVLSVIQKFLSRGENVDDLFQVGCIGLIKAIDNFDISQNVRFSTYAVPMIIGEIRRYLRDNNTLRVSRSLRDLAYKAMQVRERLTREKGTEPHLNEIAAVLEQTPEDVAAALDAIQDPVSLHEPLNNSGGDELLLMDQISAPDVLEDNWVDDISLNQAMGTLSDREQFILRKRFFDGRTQMEVANEIGISQAQVSRLEKGAIARIRVQMS